MKSNIVLIGYRATGKTSVAEYLSLKTKMPVICLDKEIEKQANLSIPEIVEKHGWDEFRKIESLIVEKASKLKEHIIDTGGGVILNEKNIINLKKNGLIFWLKTDLEIIIERLKKDNPRPSLTKKSFLEEVPEVLKERTPIYKRSADYIIDSNKSIKETGEKIYEYLR